MPFGSPGLKGHFRGRHKVINHCKSKADIDVPGPSTSKIIEIEDESMDDDIYGEPASEGIYHNIAG